MLTIKKLSCITFGEACSITEWTVTIIKPDLFRLSGRSNLKTQELKRKELSLYGRSVLRKPMLNRKESRNSFIDSTSIS